MSRFAKLLLTITAIAPVLLTYALISFLNDNIIEAAILFFIFLILFFICFSLLYYMKKNLERMDFRADSAEVADSENIAILVLYLLPLLSGRSITPDWKVWLPVVLVFGLAIIASYGYHFNPLLGFFGWHFYKVRSKENVTYVLITKKQLVNVTEMIEVGQLTEYMLVDIGDH